VVSVIAIPKKKFLLIWNRAGGHKRIFRAKPKQPSSDYELRWKDETETTQRPASKDYQ